MKYSERREAMEGGDNHYPKQAETSSALTIHSDNNVTTTDSIIVATRTTTVNAAPDHEKQPLLNSSSAPQSRVLREQDMYMPISNVVRIMRSILPNYAKISDDAKEAMQGCVSEFIRFITGEANIRCQREQRKTITAEDIIWAMKETGFDDYFGPITLFKDRYRGSESGQSLGQHQPTTKRHSDAKAVAHKSFRLGNARPLGMSSVMPSRFIRPVGSIELTDSTRPVRSFGPVGAVEPTAPIGPLLSFGSIRPATYNLSHQQSFYDPCQMNPSNFKNNNLDSAGASSSQVYLPEFDPNFQFK